MDHPPRHTLAHVRAHTGPLRREAMNLYTSKRHVDALGGALQAAANIDRPAALHLARAYIQRTPGHIPIHAALDEARELFGAPPGELLDTHKLSGGSFFSSLGKAAAAAGRAAKSAAKAAAAAIQTHVLPAAKELAKAGVAGFKEHVAPTLTALGKDVLGQVADTGRMALGSLAESGRSAVQSVLDDSRAALTDRLSALREKADALGAAAKKRKEDEAAAAKKRDEEEAARLLADAKRVQEEEERELLARIAALEAEGGAMLGAGRRARAPRAPRQPRSLAELVNMPRRAKLGGMHIAPMGFGSNASGGPRGGDGGVVDRSADIMKALGSLFPTY